MDRSNKQVIKINPNEYGSLLFDTKEAAAVNEVITQEKIFRYSGRYVTKSDKFESAIQKYFDINHALGVNNGTSALKAALFAVGVKPGDRVLISAYTFIATAEAVIHLGAIPIPIDLDMESGLKLTQLESELRKGCSAIVAVHLQGRCFNLESTRKLCQKYKTPFIEDACQAFGAKFKNVFAGTFADIGVFSFQQNKQISSGEGGLLITNDSDYYNSARNFIDHGAVRDRGPSWDDEGACIGENARINNIQAAILLCQLEKLSKIIELQHKNKQYLLDEINSSLINLNIISDEEDSKDTSMNLLFLVDDEQKASTMIEEGERVGVIIRQLWNQPYYLRGVMQERGYTPAHLGSSACDFAEDIACRMLAIPIPPILTIADMNIIIDFLAQHTK